MGSVVSIDTLIKIADNTGTKLWAVFLATLVLGAFAVGKSGNIDEANGVFILGGFGLFTGATMGHKALKNNEPAEVTP
jgi:hypothetical protein